LKPSGFKREVENFQLLNKKRSLVTKRRVTKVTTELALAVLMLLLVGYIIYSARPGPDEDPLDANINQMLAN